ncbi:hypothetical protein OO013_17055 [Mangrovivirga sp. M17]|uniref:Lipoprotein n=1 Tax=Mangrovivirga halotolerans TaxID=2993936 RepID=A0ABT3RVD1_9BACT|nr:hypothetical protein [Mangrovivirga halotolerans]MCX2745593.1 hypothetical protein [Mangrovivirga halotolerans]
MKSKYLYILVVCLLGFFSSCTSESERILIAKVENEEFDFTRLKMGNDSISADLQENIQYGLIHLQNGEQIKFWFVTHHLTSDIGGTIYEYPNGERQFCSGLHCCEVQFYEQGLPGKTFKNTDEFKLYVTERNGIKP